MAAFAGTLLSGGLNAQNAETIQTSYLHNASIGYVSPTAPADGSSLSAADLDVVRADQTADEARRHEAFEDAATYDYDLLLPRFSAAMGTQADLHARPRLFTDCTQRRSVYITEATTLATKRVNATIVFGSP